MVGLFNHPKRKLRKLITEGEYSNALEFGNTLEPKYSNDPDFLFIMGGAYYVLGDADKSLEYFERILKINDLDTDALLLSARVYVYLKNNSEARRRCVKILEIDEEHRDARELIESIYE